MELSPIRSFIAVVDAGSMSQAAADLSVSQPTISRQIKKLERELGCALFDRHDRGVHLTDAGRMFYDGVSKVLSDLHSVSERIRSYASRAPSMLRIGLVQIAQWYPVIPQLLDRFRRHHPDILVEGSQILSRRQPEALLSGEVDVAIGAPIFGLPDGIHSIGLFELPRGVVMSCEHPLADRPFLTAAETASFPLIGYSRTTWPASNDALMEEGRRHGVALNFTEAFDSATMLLARVGASDSLALLPQPGPLAPMDGLLFKRVLDLDVTISIRMCWLPDGANPYVARFIEEMRDLLPSV